MTFSLVALASHSCLVDTNTQVQCLISHIPSRRCLSTATTCCRHHGHYPSDDELIEFDVMSTMSLRRPVRLLLFLSTTLWTDHPSSSRHHHCSHLLFSPQDEEGNLIDFSSIQHQRNLELVISGLPRNW